MAEKISPQAQRFKIYRKYLKLTQKELADKLDREQGTIARYEQGARLIFPDDVKKLRDLFGLSYTWFYEGIGKMNDDTSGFTDEVLSKGNNDDKLATMLTKIEQLELRVRTLELQLNRLKIED